MNLGQKRFAEEYILACQKLDVQCQNLRSKNTCLFLKGGEVEVYHLNKKISLDNVGYAFFRVRGNYPLMTSLLGRIFSNQNISFNDVVNIISHTQNDEKVTQMLSFTLARIPIPNSLLFTLDGFEANKEIILSKIPFPCVLKANGSQGRTVWRVNDCESLIEKMTKVEKKHEVVILQENIVNQYDIRALYFYGQCLGAMKRMSKDGFYNNVSRGGSIEKTEITAEEEDIAVKACQIAGCDFGGVDMVRTPEGPLVFEVNTGPQVYGLEEATKTNVPRAIVERVKEDFLDTT